MSLHEVASPAPGGSGLKITFKRTLPNPSPVPSTSTAPSPAPLDNHPRPLAAPAAQSARSASRETPAVKIRIANSAAGSKASDELTGKYEGLKDKFHAVEEVRRVSRLSSSCEDRLLTRYGVTVPRRFCSVIASSTKAHFASSRRESRVDGSSPFTRIGCWNRFARSSRRSRHVESITATTRQSPTLPTAATFYCRSNSTHSSSQHQQRHLLLFL